MDTKVNPLWTRDFTIITLGTVVSMFGNAMCGFALSLLILDYTNSAFLYAIYIACFTAPQIITPVFSGAVLDRFSRKKTIYTLDYISGGIMAIAAIILHSGWFSFPILAVGCFIIGAINSIYLVAYESFYPLLITEGNFQKAYSISSVLETMSALMIPVSTYVYNLVGIAPLLAVNAGCFIVAATLETQIGAAEHYIEKQKENRIEGAGSAKQLFADIREGIKYITSEKGLMAVTLYFMMSAFGGGASQVITLPYFKGSFDNGEYIYMIVWGMAIVGRCIGGSIHYKFRLPVDKKFIIALCVYVIISVNEGIYLYLPIPIMMFMCFGNGILGVTSYTIRISATQSYVPDEKKGRFNAAFNLLSTSGQLLGELIAGALTAILSARLVLSSFMVVVVISAFVFILGNKAAVSRLYNTQQ